jgi:hypothetical protein
MFLQIYQYNKKESCFVFIQGLEYYKEFKTFNIFKDLKEIEEIQEFKEFKEFKKFKEFKEFKELLFQLSFIFYYKDFKLLLCFSCSSSINLANFKGYLGKHFQDLKSKKRNIVISKVISILQDLEVLSPFLSLELIQTASFLISSFKKLNIISNLF